MTDIAALAMQAARHWGGLAVPPRLIKNRENAVFEVQLNDTQLDTGPRAALRLHRQGYQSFTAIDAELQWTARLADTGFPCPRPVPTQDGALVATMPGGRAVSMVSWIDAAPIGESGVPFAGPLGAQCALYEQLGALIACLHAKTAQMDLTHLDRPSWNIEGLLGDAPLWGRFWENPALTKPEADTLQNARQKAVEQLQNTTGLDKILIHADLIQENVLQNANGLHIIDFDDSGFGVKPYDLGAALIQHVENPALDDLTKALCAGYGCNTDLMPLFIMLRGMASCGWIMSRAPTADPKQRFYAERALRCAQRYMSSHV